MDWYSIFVTCFFSFSIARADILEGPKSSVYPEGSNVTLKCLVERRYSIVWDDLVDNTEIFIDKEKYTQKVKYENFIISNAEDNFSLTIVNVQLSDEGFYSCGEGDERRSANVTVEAGPDLSILVNNTVLVPGSRITITEDEQVFVVCKADGAKPAVYLKLKFGENEWIETNNTIIKNGLRFTTETRAVHRVKRTDTTVSCQATGQVSIPPSTTMISIDVLHKPACVIELGTNVAECQCVSNPAVTAYSWYINGKLQSTDPSLRIHGHIPANLTCLASNEVGTSPLTSRYVSSTDLQRAESKDKFDDAEEVFPRDDEENLFTRASASGKATYDPGLTQLVSLITAAISYDWEIFAIEDLNLKTETVKKIIRQYSKVSDQLRAALKHWVTSCPEASRSYLENEILAKSEVYDYYRESPWHSPRRGEHNAASRNKKSEKGESYELFSQVATFSKLVEEVAKCVGHIGAHRLSYQYRELNVDLFTNSQFTALTGENFIKLLQEENLLTDDMESLRRLKKALDDSLLFRASYLVDTYIN